LFDLNARFFVPTHDLPLASCRDAVKAGRCAAGAAAPTLPGHALTASSTRPHWHGSGD